MGSFSHVSLSNTDDMRQIHGGHAERIGNLVAMLQVLILGKQNL